MESDTLSLDTSKQRAVASKMKKLQRKIKTGRLTIKERRKVIKLKIEQTRGLIYIGHLPHGFYEEEIKKYFSQFGKITNVKVCRSRNTGNSKGYGYVEFADIEVAKIAAETMNNYIMFKRRLIAEFVPYEKRPKAIFQGKQSMPGKFSRLRQRDKNNASRNKKTDQETHLKKSKVRLVKLQKRLQKLKKFGIDYDVKPVDAPEGIAQ